MATLSGPVTTGHLIEPASPVSYDMASYGYTENEYLASGTATAFRAVSQPSDGRWTVVPTTSAPYQTRIVARYPTDQARFNGTVLVEWLNVSGGVEADIDWGYLNPELMEAGFAYVAVSAQAFGVDDLVTSEPTRYGTLHHPGDRYALDIYAQIGRALQEPANAVVFGDLQPKHVIAVGESQAAFLLTTMVNAIQPRTNAFNGYFIHSRAGSAAGADGTLGDTNYPVVRIRTDLHVPVFMFETETDMVQFGYAGAQQPDTRHIRTWEVAGTAHADAYEIGAYAKALGCTKPVNTGPQHEVVQAALADYQRWLAKGTPPPSPAPLKLVSETPPVLARDKNGNAIGGVRTPAVDVPVATLSGSRPPGVDGICTLFGSTRTFGPSRLVDLYRTQSAYLALFERSLEMAIAAGYILPADKSELSAVAEQVRF